VAVHVHSAASEGEDGWRPGFAPRAHLLRLFSVAIFCVAGCSRGGGSVTATNYPANSAHSLAAVILTDQDGRPVALRSFNHTPVLIDFIYTSCPGPCPMLTSKMASIGHGLGPKFGSRIRFATITVDPEHDSPARLKTYARGFDADSANWLFLTGSPHDIDRVLAGFGLSRKLERDGSVGHVLSSLLVGSNGDELREYDGATAMPAAVVADVNRFVP
jgi:protein SCO1